MSHLKNTGFADRISAQQEAKKAMLAKFKAKPTVQDPDFDKREEQRAAELEAVRAARAEAKEKARLEALARQEELMAAKRAERNDSDLIVIGKHGASLLQDWLLGSVTKQVLAQSQGDVLMSV